jgi:hypothetical protein
MPLPTYASREYDNLINFLLRALGFFLQRHGRDAKEISSTSGSVTRICGLQVAQANSLHLASAFASGGCSASCFRFFKFLIRIR